MSWVNAPEWAWAGVSGSAPREVTCGVAAAGREPVAGPIVLGNGPDGLGTATAAAQRCRRFDGISLSRLYLPRPGAPVVRGGMQGRADWPRSHLRCGRK